MRAFELCEFGIDGLRATDRPEPEVGPLEVKVAIRARSLNYRDLMMVQATYNPRQPLPLIPLSDGVGQIVAVGADVEDHKVGDRVAPLFCENWKTGRVPADALKHTLGGPLDGVLAEKITRPAAAVVPVPEHLSDAEAATLPCAALTAYSALVTEGRLQPGQTVLVQGTGGVSSFALLFAKAMGATVLATTGKEENLQWLKAQGAEEVINYRTDPQWGKTIRRLGGVDHIIEVGGVGTMAQSLTAVRPGGTISLIGVLAGPSAPLNLTAALMNQIKVQGIFVGSRSSFEAMNELMTRHQLRPTLDRDFDFEESRAAFNYLADAKHRGKITISGPEQGA